MSTERDLYQLWHDADQQMQQAMETYHEANRRIHANALVALAAMVLDRVPAATGIEVESSDQGDWLSLNAIVTSDGARMDYDTHGADGLLEEAWQDMDSYCANLDDNAWSDLWQPFTVEPAEPAEPAVMSVPTYVFVLDPLQILRCGGDVERLAAEVKP